MTSAGPQLRPISIENGRLSVRSFSTLDSDIVTYFQEVDPELLGERFEYVLKTGVVTLKTVATKEKIDYIQKEFMLMNTTFSQSLTETAKKLDDHLTTVFKEDGTFAEVLDVHFGENGKIVRELFDPSRKGSPLNTLREEIRSEFSRLKVDLKLEEKTNEMEQKTTLKGPIFEDQCEETLAKIARMNGDKLERTSKATGKVRSSLKGDFVLQLHENSKKIVLEVKDVKQKLTYPEIQKYLDEAIENRGAVYGIYLVRNVEALPQSVGFFSEHDGNKLVGALGDTNSDGSLYNEILLIAYRWAKAKVLVESSKEDRIDSEFIRTKISKIQKKLSELRTIKVNCTNIETTSQKIHDSIGEMEQEINKDLSEVLDSLTSTQTETS